MSRKRGRSASAKNMTHNTTETMTRIAARGAAWIVVAALTAGRTMAVLAAETNTPKEENIYVNLNQDGSVDGVYVVNAYQLDKPGTIVDYGKYESVRNLTSDSELNIDGDRITVQAEKGKFFYQGNLESRDIPWDISIRYFLDGKEVEAEELAGENGALRIEIHVGKNEKLPDAFFDNYLVQATVTMNMDKCSGLRAEGATVGNVGINKQLVYNILAGQEKDIIIQAQVTDFEMDPISMQCVPMSLDIDSEVIDKTKLYDKTGEIKDAAGDFDEGADKLDGGVSDLHSGAEDLDSGAADLQEGAKKVDDGAADLQSGVEELRNGADNLKSGAGTLKSGADDLKDGAGTLKNGASDLKSGAGEVKSGAVQLQEGINQAKDGADAMAANFSGDGTAQNPGALNVWNSIASALGAVGGQMESLPADIASAVGAGLVNAGNSAAAKGSDGSLQSEAMSAAGSDPDVAGLPGAVAGEINTAVNSAVGDAVRNALPSEDSLKGAMSSDAIKDALTAAGVDEETARGTAEAIRNGYASAVSAALSGVSVPGIDVSASLGNVGTAAAGLYAKGYAAGYAAGAAYVLQDAAPNEINSAMSGVMGGLGNVDMTQLSAAVSGMSAYMTGLSQGAADLRTGLARLQEGSRNLVDGTGRLYDGTSSLADGANSLYDGTASLADGANALYSGTDTLVSGSITLKNGADTLKSGTGELYSGTGDLKKGTGELLEGTQELKEGTTQLREGTVEFLDKTLDIDEQIDGEIDEMIGKFSGGDFHQISYISDKNRNVRLVQFALKTGGIAIPEPTREETETVSLSLWEKIKNLFR